MDAVVLAGGLGSRLRSVVADRPKPMALVNGRPFLEYLFDYWITQGVSRFVLSVGYLKDMIASHFGAAYRGKSLDYVFENTPLGTGGGLLKVVSETHLGSRFLVLNGDTFFGVSLLAFSAFHESNSADLSIAMRGADSAGRYGGMQVDETGRLTSFFAQACQHGMWSNGGVYLVNRSALLIEGMPGGQSGKVSLEAELIPLLLAAGKGVFGFPCQANFVDIGIPEDYHRAGSIIAST